MKKTTRNKENRKMNRRAGAFGFALALLLIVVYLAAAMPASAPAPVPSPLIHHASVQPEKVLPGDLMTVTASQQILLVSGIPSITKNTKFCYECYRRLS
jgi:hypothetical protein